MQHGHDLGIDSALAMAEVIHDDLTTGGVVSWQWWLCVGAGGYQDALIYADPKTQKIEPTKRLWVLGQYSRFVRPGFTRVGVDVKGEALKATAYLSPDGSTVVCVVINSAKTPATMGSVLRGFAARRTTLYVTDASHDLAVIDSSRDITLPARSVASIVFQR
jgi:O-glycosyl hydrolase